MRVKDRMFKSTKPHRWSRVLCIDPGVRHLGFAFWPVLKRGPKVKTRAPKHTGLIVTPKSMGWEDAVFELMGGWLNDFICVHDVQRVVIEFAEFWGDSERSQIAAKKGDLIRLAFLVGALGNVVWNLCEKKAVIIEPTKWKGDMPKPVMKKRVRRALHRKYREHEYDAVAMGLRIMGKL